MLTLSFRRVIADGDPEVMEAPWDFADVLEAGLEDVLKVFYYFSLKTI